MLLMSYNKHRKKPKHLGLGLLLSDHGHMK